MKILIIASEFLSLTGSPMYNYTLAIELKRQGYDVDVFSVFSNNETRNNLFKFGVNPITKLEKEKQYDILLISQHKFEKVLNTVKYNIAINVVHSEYVEETPIINPFINFYIAIRPSIKEVLISKYNINPNKIEVIYNGIDFNRFNPEKRKKHDGDYTKVVIPCTIDKLRADFLTYYENKASEDFRVYIYGKNYEKRNFTNKWVFYHEEVFDIENYIYDADYIAGILLGRVNLEAKAMGIPSYIHNPKKPTESYLFDLEDNEFNNRHNIENVAKSIIAIYHNSFTTLKTDIKPIIHEDQNKVNNLVKKIFTNLYKTNKDIFIKSASGTGSDLSQTIILRSELTTFLKNYDINTMLDIPCGDFYWMNETDLTNIKYIGADIVDEIVINCNKKYPHTFKVMDIVNSQLPSVDLIFSRDCFVLLPNDMIKNAIENIKLSGSKYLMTTSFVRQVNNTDTTIGRWRSINLTKSPFNLPAPFLTINENCTENNGKYKDKSMCVWKISEI
jgi:glycosyltransferase involved in cell wall biosynthesis